MPRSPLLSPPPILLASVAACALSGCSKTVTTERIEPTIIEVSVDGELGSPDAPLAFSGDTVSRTITVQTLDAAGQPYPFEGDLSVRVRPGKLDQAQWISVTGGQWTGTIDFHAAFGPTRIWASDEGDKDGSTGRLPSFATGVTEELHYAFPTIAELNRIDDHETNQLAGEFAELSIAERQVVVTEIGTNGFWCTDIADEAGSYNSLYVYTFSKPEGIWQGARLVELTGNDQEYLATTQLSFPVYSAEEGSMLDVPEAIEIPVEATCDDDLMEAMESSLVTVTGASIPDDFNEGSADYADYIEYGQWPIELAGGGCRIYVDSTVSTDFAPTDMAGQEVGDITGMLREIWGKWIITARGEGDIGAGSGIDDVSMELPDGTCSHSPGSDHFAHYNGGHPRPRPRPASH